SPDDRLHCHGRLPKKQPGRHRGLRQLFPREGGPARRSIPHGRWRRRPTARRERRVARTTGHFRRIPACKRQFVPVGPPILPRSIRLGGRPDRELAISNSTMGEMHPRNDSGRKTRPWVSPNFASSPAVSRYFLAPPSLPYAARPYAPLQLATIYKPSVILWDGLIFSLLCAT